MLHAIHLRYLPLLSALPYAVSLFADAASAQSLVRSVPAFSPPALDGAQMAYDLGRLRGVLFGGLALDPVMGFNASDATFEWDGQAWSLVQATVRPPGRTYHTLGYDGTRTILYGGVQITGLTFQELGDTWAFDGVAWTQLAPALSPPARGGASMVYDVARGRLVLFGGADTNQYFNDTWEWDGVTWTLRSPAVSPPVRANAHLVYDPLRSRIVLFGGSDFSSTAGPQLLQDTWEYDGVTWAQVSTATSPPTRISGNLDFDLLSSRAVLVGGSDLNGTLADAWAYDGTNWSALTLANAISIAGSAHTFDPLQQRVVYFGGVSFDPSSPSPTSGPIDFTLLLVPGPASAAYASFGAGCDGTAGNVPVLAAAPYSLPVIGTTFAATIDYAPIAAPVAVILMGFSNTTWAGGALPFNLSVFGIGGGCNLLVDPAAAAVVGNGTDPAVFRFSIPLDPQLTGIVFHNQALVLDTLATNGLGGLTNGCTATVQ